MAIKYIHEDKLRSCISRLENILATDLSNPLPVVPSRIFWRMQTAIKAITEELDVMLTRSNNWKPEAVKIILVEEKRWILRAIMALWLKIRIANGYKNSAEVDVEHSALLGRLLSGLPPYKMPPPKINSYPDYKLAEQQQPIIYPVEWAVFHTYWKLRWNAPGEIEIVH